MLVRHRNYRWRKMVGQSLTFPVSFSEREECRARKWHGAFCQLSHSVKGRWRHERRGSSRSICKRERISVTCILTHLRWNDSHNSNSNLNNTSESWRTERKCFNKSTRMYCWTGLRFSFSVGLLSNRIRMTTSNLDLITIRLQHLNWRMSWMSYWAG